MKKKLSEKLKDNIRQAIKLAKKPGMCEYTFPATGKPCCVIGQLMHIENMDLEVQNSSIDFLLREGCKAVAGLKKYPLNLLTDLQCEWDGADSSKQAKATMLAMVDSYFQ